MSNIPEIVRVRIMNVSIGHPLGNIFVMIKIFAKHKNDYYIIPSKSDSDGYIKIAKSWLSYEIEKSRDFFVMDYASKLDDCYPKMLVWIMSKDELDKSIKGRKLYQSSMNISDEEIEELVNADNGKYKPSSKLIEFENQDNIEVVLDTTSAI